MLCYDFSPKVFSFRLFIPDIPSKYFHVYNPECPTFSQHLYIDCAISRRLLYTVRSINETFKSKLIYETQKGSVSRIPVMRRYQNNTIGSVFALYYLNCCRCGYFRCVKAENAVITKKYRHHHHRHHC